MKDLRLNTLKRYEVKGFTLVELIVVILILGILSAIITPAIMKWIGKSRAAVVMKAGSDFHDAILIATAQDINTGAAGMQYDTKDSRTNIFYESITNAKPAPTSSRAKLIYDAMDAGNKSIQFAAIALFNNSTRTVTKVRIKDLSHNIVLEWTIEDKEWQAVADSDEAWTRPYTSACASDPQNVWWNGVKYSENDFK